MKKYRLNIIAFFLLIACSILFNNVTLLAKEEIPKYIQNYYLSGDNRIKVKLVISLSKNLNDTVIIPINNKSVIDLNFSQNSFGYLFMKDNHRYFKIIKRDKQDSVMITITFTDTAFFNLKKAKIQDFGNYSFEYRFSNISETKFKNVQTVIFLPPDYAITSIDESYPKPSNKNPNNPCEVKSVNNLNTISIKNANFDIGDELILKFRFKQDSKSKILFAALLLSAVLYLIIFRDLINFKKKKK
jgi:hypothetical protein